MRRRIQVGMRLNQVLQPSLLPVGSRIYRLYVPESRPVCP